MTKRILAMILALIVVAGLMSACQGGGGGSAASSGSKASASQPSGSASGGTPAAPVKIEKITQLVWDRGSIPAEQGTLENNWWVDFVNEQMAPLGVEVGYVMIPRQQEAELLSTMLAAQNAPDLCKTNEVPLVKTYISGGGVADMGPAIEQYGQNIKALYSESELRDGQVGGKQYVVYHKNNGFARTTWIRKDWLDAVGLDIPKGAEQFKAMLKAFKDQDPGKVGEALMTFGLTGEKFTLWDVVVMPAFLEEAPTAEKLLMPRIMWPEAKDTLRYLNGLYNEGLMGEFILDKDESMLRQKIARGELASMSVAGHYMYHSAYGMLYDKLREAQPGAQMIATYPWENSKGQNFKQIYDNLPPTYVYQWFIPSSSKNVDATVKFLDWMCSETGYMTASLGIEGVDYQLTAEGFPQPINNDTYLARVPWIEPQYGVAAKPYPNPDEKDIFLKNYIKDFNPDYYAEIEANVMFLSDVQYFKPVVTLPTPKTDKVVGTLTQKFNDNIAKIICAPAGQFDKIFDDFLADYIASGGQESYEEQLAAYKQQ